MDDLISRQAIMKEFADFVRRSNNSDFAPTPTWNDAVSLVGSMPSAQRWIPVTERLPEENEAVNIVWVNRSPVIYYQDIKDKPQSATGVYYRGQWYWWSAVVQDYLAEYGEWDCDKMNEAIEVTHWMPLPVPYREDGEQGAVN